MMVNNVIGLIVSVVFARELKDYGALAALLSYLVILTVVGQALQVATARESVLGRLGMGPDLIGTLLNWARWLVIFTAVMTIVSIVARQPIANLVGVPRYPWAAAAGIPAGCAYLCLCIARGALQGTDDFRTVGLSLIGEQSVRLLVGAPLAAVGMGVTGAYLGSLLAYIAMLVYCAWQLWSALPVKRIGRCVHPLWPHVRGAAIAIVALGIVQLLQNVDLITAKHQFSDEVASSYAVVAVAAKVLIWVAMGAGFYLVPETSRRRAAGEDSRPVLVRTLAIIGLCAIPCLLIFAFAAHPLLSAVFGTRRAVASSSLLPLGAAFTILAATYLAVQYMLALRRTAFLLVIGLVAIIEPILLVHAPRHPASFATVVLIVQAVGAALAFSIALWSRGEPATAKTGRAAPQVGQG
jgi:O-antigen/teichoic acid export membrane protein